MELLRELQTLTCLGLTSSQARVYLSLVSMGSSAVKAISKDARVERSEAYRIMAGLEQLGLVERIISVPFKFRAIKIQHAFEILIERRHRETLNLQTAIKEICEKTEHFDRNEGTEGDEHQFILVPKKEASQRRRRKAIENSKESIDAVNSWRRAPIWMFSYREEIIRALRRGVRFRAILDKPEENKLMRELEEFKKIGDFEVRYTSIEPDAVVSIYDKKDVAMKVIAEAAHGESPTLWSNNPSFVAIAQERFERLWAASTEGNSGKPPSPSEMAA